MVAQLTFGQKVFASQHYNESFIISIIRIKEEPSDALLITGFVNQQEQIVLKRSAKLNMDPGRVD